VAVPRRVFASGGDCSGGIRLDATRFPSHVIEAFSFLAFLDRDRRGYFQVFVSRREREHHYFFISLHWALTGVSRRFVPLVRGCLEYNEISNGSGNSVIGALPLR
jgi:hypothetical protein